MTRRALGVVLVVLVLAALAGCGDDNGTPTLRVSAAASLKNAFEDYGALFNDADVSYSFAGSDELAAQIRKGARPDVFAAANTKLPAQLFAEGLVEKPVPFASNRLVLAVPADGSSVSSLQDLDNDGVRIAAGSPSVPVGSYTRKVLAKLARSRRTRSSATSVPTSRTSRASSGRSRRERLTRASSTSPTCRRPAVASRPSSCRPGCSRVSSMGRRS